MLKRPSERSSAQFDFADAPLIGRWLRAVEGYEWIEGGAYMDGPPDPGPWLVERGLIFEPYPFLRHRRSLLRELVKLGRNPTREEVIAFANKWGHLGEGEVPVMMSHLKSPYRTSFRSWSQLTTQIAMLFDLWAHVRLEDADFLAPFLTWERDSTTLRVFYVNGQLRPDLAADQPSRTEKSASAIVEDPLAAAGDRETARLLKRWRRGDPIEPLRFFICREVNAALAGRVDRMILPYLDNEVHYMPQTLLSAAYIAFQDEMTAKGKPQRTCLRCREPFSLTRGNRIYCSKNCGKRASEEGIPAQRRRPISE